MDFLDPFGKVVPHSKRVELPSEEFDQFAQEAALLGYDPLELERRFEHLPTLRDEDLFDDFLYSEDEDEEE